MNIIKCTRIKKSLSLFKMAKLLNIPVGLYWYYENHTSTITTEMMELIFGILNIKYTY